jgi:hypothetical protein
MQTNIDILATATEILGSPPAIPNDGRGWAHWWCPFHGDSQRAGQGGRPNLGINLEIGFWKCLRCGKSGGSLASLSKELGKGWKAEYSQNAVMNNFAPEAPRSQVGELQEALTWARTRLLDSPAMPYLRQRGIKPYTAMIYGLGYGDAKPNVHVGTVDRAYSKVRIVLKNGVWLWAGSVIYADPVVEPTVLNVRYLPDIPHDVRPFAIEENHHTWGVRTAPLGSWRITPRTKTIVVVEGLFDMLVGAQYVDDHRLYPEVVVVYTNGASPAKRMLQWFAENAAKYSFILIPDQDAAGLGGENDQGKFVPGWKQHLERAIQAGEGTCATINTPGGMDPDEAFRTGWWPSAI